MRLRGKGLPAVQGYGYGVGDLIVHISVYIPENLTKEERRIMEQLRQSENFIANQSIKNKIFNKFKSFFE